MSAERELRAETVIDAGPEKVWSTLADLSQMSRWSPETVAMIPLKPGGLRVGQSYVGINRRKAFVWPTRNVVVEMVPGSLLAWDTTSSGARWIYELYADQDRTRVVHRRPVPTRLTRASGLVAGTLLGGAESHADELEAGMAQTLVRLKAAVEA